MAPEPTWGEYSLTGTDSSKVLFVTPCRHFCPLKNVAHTKPLPLPALVTSTVLRDSDITSIQFRAVQFVNGILHVGRWRKLHNTATNRPAQPEWVSEYSLTPQNRQNKSNAQQH